LISQTHRFTDQTFTKVCLEAVIPVTADLVSSRIFELKSYSNIS
jgi:hypothetical protein